MLVATVTSHLKTWDLRVGLESGICATIFVQQINESELHLHEVAKNDFAHGENQCEL